MNNKSKFYVTYYRNKMNGYRTNNKAIECPDETAAQQCAMDLYSLVETRRVSINRCGRLPKNTTVIPYEKYKTGEYHKL